jgi:hypothetical protein
MLHNQIDPEVSWSTCQICGRFCFCLGASVRVQCMQKCSAGAMLVIKWYSRVKNASAGGSRSQISKWPSFHLSRSQSPPSGSNTRSHSVFYPHKGFKDSAFCESKTRHGGNIFLIKCANSSANGERDRSRCFPLYRQYSEPVSAVCRRPSEVSISARKSNQISLDI